MTAEKMWEYYTAYAKVSADYSAWSFGAAADELAQLVLEGTKTATASAYPLYALEGEDLPQAGEYSIILNSREEAVCVIQNTKVYTTAFEEVGEEQAWKEGEGDRSLSYWRQIHEPLFRKWLSEAGLEFDYKMPVVCEEFVRVYP